MSPNRSRCWSSGVRVGLGTDSFKIGVCSKGLVIGVTDETATDRNGPRLTAGHAHAGMYVKQLTPEKKRLLQHEPEPEPELEPGMLGSNRVRTAEQQTAAACFTNEHKLF